MRRSTTKRSIFALALTAATAFSAAAQQQHTDNGFHWTGKIPTGRWIRVVNLNGPITVGAASGDNVEVIATKQWRRSDPASVHIETEKFGPNNENVVVCALWDDRSSCSDRGNRGQRHYGSRNDVSVTFRVLVPRGVKVDVNTVNGAVTVDGTTSDVEAATVNGEVAVTTTGGRVNATNVNGGVRAKLGNLESDGRMNFETVNGDVSLEFTGDSGADVEMETVNGSLNTNFEMTVSGRLDPKHLRAHVGRPGGPRIRLETVNGNVEVKRRS